MWDQTGSAEGMNWEADLAWAQQKNAEKYLGYSDWRLPNAKELHSIVDYNRSPSATNSPAISPLFNVPVIKDETGSDSYPFYWTSTTHVDGPAANKAVYICFGEALGYMNGRWLDVHGAGAQRSDPKAGNPDDYPEGFGPQGDAIRINNYARLVRDVSALGDNGGSSTNSSASDFNEDKRVDYSDFLLFAKAFGAAPNSANWNPVCDLNKSGIIDFGDFLVFARHFGTLIS